MEPNCFESESIVHFFEQLKTSVPIHIYGALRLAYENRNHMFKCICLQHFLKLKKQGMAEEKFFHLVSMLDSFRDPYQDFVESVSGKTWDEIKNKIIEGVA